TRAPHRHSATPAVTARSIAAGRPAHRRPARSAAKTAGGPGAGSSSAQSSATARGAPGAGGGAGSGPSSTATGSAPRSAPLVKVSVPQGNTSVSVSAPALPRVKVSSPKVINPPTLPSVG